jgi:hypothetical protein
MDSLRDDSDHNISYMDCCDINMVNIYDKIADHLCYVDLISLTLANPRLRRRINDEKYDITKIVAKFLLVQGKFGQILKDELFGCNCYISGGFLLQCVYNVVWIDSNDIDIYCLESNKGGDKFLEIIKKNGFKQLEINDEGYVNLHPSMHTTDQFSKPINYIVVNTSSFILRGDGKNYQVT